MINNVKLQQAGEHVVIDTYEDEFAKPQRGAPDLHRSSDVLSYVHLMGLDPA